MTEQSTPWVLDAGVEALTRAQLVGWLAEACEQDPSLIPRCRDYATPRHEHLRARVLTVTVGHRDLLALPRS